MLPKEENKRRKTKFWTELDTLMKSEKGVHGNKVNWLGYKSHVKDVFIRMEFDGKGARLCIDLQQKDESIRSLFLEQFLELKTVMQSNFSTKLEFKEVHQLDASGIYCSRVMSEDDSLNFYNDNDLEKGLDFLKTQLLSLDNFWTEFKDIFIALAR